MDYADDPNSGHEDVAEAQILLEVEEARLELQGLKEDEDAKDDVPAAVVAWINSQEAHVVQLENDTGTDMEASPGNASTSATQK